MNIITSTAERQAAVEFAKAGAIRPQIVGATLDEISRDAEVSQAMFNVLETQRLLQGSASITLLPAKSALLADLLAAAPDGPKTAPKPGTPPRA